MKRFNTLGISSKITIAFAGLMFMMGVVGFSGYRSAKTIHDSLVGRAQSLDHLTEADRDLQQLLVAERSMIFSNVKSDSFKVLLNKYEENLKQANERWEAYKLTAITAEEKDLIPKYEKARNDWTLISRRVVDGRLSDTRQGRREAIDLSLGLANASFENMRKYLDSLTEINLKLAENSQRDADDAYKTGTFITLIATGIGLLMSIFFTGSLVRNISTSLNTSIKKLISNAANLSSVSNEVAAASNHLAIIPSSA